ncbi:polysaccharide deacetylase family protein [Actinomadura gamaensis]|uniref:Polysaccharide deacetylase family protein n=1 Tax=Actinomadura gamaensis TaxID=1763541 RepID=A0ABV9U1W4_9ACTN
MGIVWTTRIRLPGRARPSGGGHRAGEGRTGPDTSPPLGSAEPGALAADEPPGDEPPGDEPPGEERRGDEQRGDEQRGDAPGRMPPVLMYHSVDHYREDPHLITVTPDRFLRQMRWLEANGLRGVGVGELLAAKAAGRHRRLVGLTFDDGYADFAGQVVPVLTRMGFTATVFMVTGEIGGTNSWDDGPRKRLMSAEQLRAMAGWGMEVASHGVRHLSLPEVGHGELVRELRESRSQLEDLLQRPVTGFAYPYGNVTSREAAAVREAGYDYACAIWTSGADRHALARTYVGERDDPLRMRLKFARHRFRQRRLA